MTIWWVPSFWHSVTPPLKNPGYAYACRNCYGSWSNITWIMVLQRKWCNPLWERMMSYYLSDFGSLILIQIIPKEHTKYQTVIFVYMQKLVYHTSFWTRWNEGNLWETTKDNYHTFRHTTYIKPIRLPSPSNINHFHGTEHGRGCVNKCSLLRTRKMNWIKMKRTSSYTEGKNFVIWKPIIKVERSVQYFQQIFW